ncbi:MAG TPA: CooT family nickel-binding protein [Candidatus Aerophobetes bacterium]|uniref:CooT family nickel-binding protein n=1 Tax=Aerophobetes bacterium TaxID=2030807 RepID=A0A7V5LZ63_UNCAE|nr:CooT family nickel-binding protein [Candidatus Aerophobetes bacterium]
MCLSKVYIEKEGKKELLIEEAAKVKIEENLVEILELLGDVKRLEGYKIKEIDFLNHFVILGKIKK